MTEILSGAAIKERYWLPLYAAKHEEGAWETLDAAYSAPDRAYHGWAHIGDLLQKLDRFSHLAVQPKLIGTAIFWHDAVYKTQNPDGSPRPDAENVRDSARLFMCYTLLDTGPAWTVHDMILGTADHQAAQMKEGFYSGVKGDFDLFIDLDLSILGAPEKEFARYEDNIRKEYAWVPEAVFCGKRGKILSGFAEAKRIFRREETEQLWGAQARANLQRSVRGLEIKHAELTAPL